LNLNENHPLFDLVEPNYAEGLPTNITGNETESIVPTVANNSELVNTPSTNSTKVPESVTLKILIEAADFNYKMEGFKVFMETLSDEDGLPIGVSYVDARLDFKTRIRNWRMTHTPPTCLLSVIDESTLDRM